MKPANSLGIPAPRPSADGDSPIMVINRIDTQILELVCRRSQLSDALPRGGAAAGSAFPGSFRVTEVVARYVEAFGAPGELVARAVLNASLHVYSPADPLEPHVASDEIARIDGAIIDLLACRLDAVQELPANRREDSERVHEVVAAYERALGGPGALVGRSVINVARGTQRQPR